MNIYDNNKQLLNVMGGDSYNLATDFEVRKAILDLLGGDSSNCNSIYEVDKQILNIYLEGGGGTGGDITLSPITIGENGVYNAGFGKGYSRVTVEVPLTELNVTDNGIYSRERGGYNEVRVNVPKTPLTAITINSNGTYIPEEGGYNEVVVNVAGGGSGESSDFIELRNSLTSYSNSTIEEIPAYTFSGCGNLTTVDLPECKTVGDKSFYECYILSSYNLPKVEYVGVECFCGCRSLTTVDLPECKEIGYGAFECCHNLATLNLPKVEKLYEGVFREIAITTLSLPECKEMGWDVFCRCPNLTTVDLPKCINLYDGNAFIDCPNLTTVNAPVCTNIGGETFARCSSFTSLDLSNTYYCQLQDISAFNDTPFMNGEGTIYVHASALPLFQNDTNWAMLADRFVGVGDESKPILTFSDGTLFGYTTSVSGDVKGVFGLGDLTTIELPECDTVGNNVFEDIDTLLTVDLPKCKSIGEWAFWGCDSITTLNLPMCETIQTSAFEGNKITTLDLPECKYIGRSAFQYSGNLTTINLPKCEKLENNAFGECPNIRTLYIGTELDVVCNADAWPNIHVIETIYVPANLVEEYKNSNYWNNFVDIIVGI